MKKILFSLLPVVMVNILSANDALFSYFTYTGNDERFNIPIDNKTEYLNPILAGFYPDPAVCKKGDTFYLVNSSFSFFPGVPIFESKDLVNWKQTGHILDRDSQLDLNGLGVSRGIFAPAISYNPANDTFYMITTLVDNGGNFFVKSKDPSQGWSEPVWLPAVDGIDPSFLFDKDGKGYIVHNAPVNGTPRYEGERSIRLLYFDVEKDITIGAPIEIVRSGTHVRENPIWIEGPHLYHIGDYYYLMCAEGGTGEDHSEVIFRAKTPEGPWEESPFNPILTQREGLDPDRENKVTSTGHADLIQGNDGKWWAVFLGCRPYGGDLYNTGRDTFLLPVEWKDGWPVILEASTPVPTVVKKSGLNPSENHLTGNFSVTDNFKGDSLNDAWIFLRNPIPGFYTLTENGLVITPSDGSINSVQPVSAIFRRQQHTDFTAETEVDFQPGSSHDLAGLALLQNENYNFEFGKTLIDNQAAVVLKRGSGNHDIIASAVVPEQGALKLKVEGNGRYYSFYYSTPQHPEWEILAKGVDASNLSTSKSGGFIGAVIGPYATKNF